MQRHIFDDVVALCSKYGKISPQNKEFQIALLDNIIELIVQMQTLLNCYPAYEGLMFLIGRQGAHYGTF